MTFSHFSSFLRDFRILIKLNCHRVFLPLVTIGGSSEPADAQTGFGKTSANHGDSVLVLVHVLVLVLVLVTLSPSRT